MSRCLWRLGRSFVLILLVTTTLSLPIGASSPPTEQSSPLFTQVADSDIDPDSVLMAVALESDGSARWRVEYRIRLDNDNVSRAFSSLREDIDSDPEAYTGPFASRMAATAATAENTTGREMEIRNVTVSAQRTQLPQEYGVVTYNFEWAGFAKVDGDRLTAGDAITSLFLDRETTLLVSWPSNYHLLKVSPAPDDRRDQAVSWTGRLDFTIGEPLIVVSASQPTESAGSVNAEPTPQTQSPESQADAGTTGPGPTDSGIQRTINPLIITVGILALLGIGSAGFWLRKRPSNEVQSNGDSSTEPSEAVTELPEELLSNEERVISLIRDRGGRIKQKEVTEELDWTDAKTSTVISDLRETGRIDSFRLGRENVLSLPDDPDSDE